MEAEFLMKHVDSATFKKLCKDWIVSVRANEEYSKRKDVEMAIIEMSPRLCLDIDEVMDTLYHFAMSNEPIVE